MTGSRPRRVVRDVAPALLVVWLLVVGHQVARWTTAGPGPGPGSGGPWGPPWRGSPPTGGPPDLDPWASAPAVALAVAIGVAVGLRRFAPLPTLGVVVVASIGYLLTGGPVPPTLLAVAVTAVAATRRHPDRRWWWPSLAAVVIMVWSSRWTAPTLGLTDPQTYLLVVAGVAVVLVPMLAATVRLERRRALERQRRDELEQAATQERLRIARDIHDVVGHSLSMISLQAGVALHVIDSDPAQVRASLQAIRDSSRSSLTEIRQTVGAFRTADGAPLAPAAGLGDVGTLVAGVRAAGRTVRLETTGDLSSVPPLVQQAGHRIVQEALTNAVRHTTDAAITVTITTTARDLTVLIADDGGRVDADWSPGHGIRGITERAQAVGGTVEIGPRSDRGFAVRARIPVDREQR